MFQFSRESPQERQRKLQSAIVYIPVAGSPLDFAIDACSGVVGYINPEGVLVCYMEGNRLGASNLQLYEERIKQAAGRMFTAYPTVARLWLPRVELEANLIEVGRISREYEIQFSRPGLALAYGATPGAVLNTEDGRQFVKTLSGHWYDGFDFKSHFDEPEGTFSVKERQPATT